MKVTIFPVLIYLVKNMLLKFTLKSIKALALIYSDMDCLIKRLDGCRKIIQNNRPRPKQVNIYCVAIQSLLYVNLMIR